MQKLLFLLIILLGLGFILTKGVNELIKAHPTEVYQEEDITPTESILGHEEAPSVSRVTKSVFVPYWSLQNTEGLSEYDSSVYFGISVTEEGVNRTDQGFANIQTFVSRAAINETYLTVRMLDTETNLEILERKKAQEAVIKDVIAVAEEYNFEGIVLDLELSVIPFTDVTENINMFVASFSEELNSHNLAFHVTLYGDTYYRSRPYDVEKIGSYADKILIMAYDFHKSRGEPGPNFPFSGQKTYGYDFQQMINDFSQDVPVEKLAVIFGLYGYDWTLGKGGMPLTSATAFSLVDAELEFVPTCNYESCKVARDPESKEMKVTYIDDEEYRHTAWFEDEESVEIKTEYLKEQGIGNISYWTWGYW